MLRQQGAWDQRVGPLEVRQPSWVVQQLCLGVLCPISYHHNMIHGRFCGVQPDAWYLSILLLPSHI